MDVVPEILSGLGYTGYLQTLASAFERLTQLDEKVIAVSGPHVRQCSAEVRDLLTTRTEQSGKCLPHNIAGCAFEATGPIHQTVTCCVKVLRCRRRTSATDTGDFDNRNIATRSILESLIVVRVAFVVYPPALVVFADDFWSAA